MKTLALTSALSAAAAAVGSLGTTPESEWYRSLEKPPWQPPPVAFPLVWTPLYGLIAYGTGRLVDSDPEARGRLLALTTADLVVNESWNWAFFDRQSPRAALAPYVAWTGFATVLNAAIWRRNR